ncbi:TRAP transporter substrate-binding protein [Roseomonas marmotae]|uniref:TRAP transporter substrate-binding protein n=1 Tax=Roseomonas marmotae TaxID=2768161 RepID=A0ABS3KAL7_9PROT|nr:TRAP transporter substrate-binding protein [Roseomonas marmotae]MBO1074482.1 TRAP transporter substrate-binding protein [Roseomonas marmotae]QTI78214.1 TRAP transporter substrate-binding protein [Roseomonas marmotae]
MFATLPVRMRPWCHILGAAGILAALLLSSGAKAEEPLRLKVVGGLADVSQYVRYEEPFWRKRISELTNGRVVGEIAPFDRAGFRAEEMLQLMRLGVVPFGTALLAIVSSEEPEFNAVDLPALNPDFANLRQTVRLYRPHLKRLLQERYGTELLAVYTYPAQVTWCRRPFTGLADLAGRRIRASSVGQAEMFEALGATPVVIPFAGIVEAMKAGVVECAVTGTLSGNAVGLQEVTSHIHSMALTWGVSVFGANQEAWRALPQDIREVIQKGLTDLEESIWEAAARETGEGLDCSAGKPGCTTDARGSLTIVPVTPADDARRRSLLVQTVLPRWVDRCGPDCADAWNRYLGPTLGIPAYAH